MAKSNDCCLNDGCFSLAAKGLTVCLSCWDDLCSSSSVEGSLSGENALCDGCGKEECFCSFVDLVESDWAESVAEQEEELTDCTQSCKEMGMMSEGCDFCL